MLLAVALIAVALLFGTLIRVSTSPNADEMRPGLGGVRALGPDEQLVLFEDYAFNRGGWPAPVGTAQGIAPEGLMGPITQAGPLSRVIDLPPGSANATLAMDVIGLSPEAAPVTLTVNEQVAARISFDLFGVQAAPDTRVVLRSRPLGSDGLRQRLRLSLAEPGPTLTLTLTPVEGGMPNYAVDNLSLLVDRAGIPDRQ